MNIFRKHDFGEVQGIEMGYGPMGKPFMNVIFYLVDGVLIDTGQSHMKRYFTEAVKDKKIHTVILTHHHEDHSGNASVIKEMRKVPVYAHPESIGRLRDGFRILPYQHLVWGSAGRLTAEPLPGIVQGEHRAFIPVHTPGHSSDHVSYLEKNRGWLFSGDLYLGRKIKYFREDEDMHATLGSLKKVLDLDFDSLFCSHNPQIKDGKRFIGEKLKFLEDFCGEMRGYYDRGYDADGVVKLLRSRESKFIVLLTFGNASFAQMVRSAFRMMNKE